MYEIIVINLVDNDDVKETTYMICNTEQIADVQEFLKEQSEAGNIHTGNFTDILTDAGFDLFIPDNIHVVNMHVGN